MNNSSISQTVMRRVHRIHVLRTIAAPVFGVVVFLVALWGIGREVWVAKVFENMPSLANVPAVVSFSFHAFLATDLFVQILSIVVIGSLIMLARSFASVLSGIFRPA